MSYVLVITAPDGTVLQSAAPWLTRRQRDSAGMRVAHGRRGVPLVHQATGIVFCVERADTDGLTLLSAIPAQAAQ